MTAVASPLVRKLTHFMPMRQAEVAMLDRLEAQRRTVAAGIELVHEHQAGHHVFILEHGWACSYKDLPDGGRQIIDFPIPGDVMGLRSVLLRASDHSFATVTDVHRGRSIESPTHGGLRAAAQIGYGVLVGCIAR